MIPATEFSVHQDGSVFHLHLRPEDIADIIFLVGDQDRVDMFKDFFERIDLEKRSREFHTLTGWYKGRRMTALSTGIGTDNIDIAVTELDGLANIDLRTMEPKEEHRSLTLIRIGTSGAIQPDIPVGGYVFSHYAVGLDNVLNYYAGRDEVCDADMEKSFLEQVRWNRHLHDPYFVKADEALAEAFSPWTIKGMTLSASGFYGPQGRVVRAGIAMPEMLEDFENFRYTAPDGQEWRLTNFEMESSVLFGLSKILGHRAGTVCSCIGNRYHKATNTDYHALIHTLVEKTLDTASNDSFFV